MRFKNSTFLLAGPSSCGKTTFCIQLIRDSAEAFADGRCGRNVICFYSQWQPAYDVASAEGLVHHWINEVPTAEKIKEHVYDYKDIGGSIVIIDDMGERLNRDIVELFRIHSHHWNVTCFLLAQSLFSKNQNFRAAASNATYTIAWKNPRDKLAISMFSRQFAPGDSKYVMAIYDEATKKPHSYLLFDMHQQTPDGQRIRSNVLIKEFPMCIWTKKTCSI